MQNVKKTTVTEIMTFFSGLITIAWGFIGFFTIPDSPANTRALWLTKPEREVARRRMSSQGTTVQEFISRKALQRKLMSMVRSPLTYFFLAAYLQFAWSQRANSYFLLYLKICYSASFDEERLDLKFIVTSRDLKMLKGPNYTARIKSISSRWAAMQFQLFVT